MSATGQPISSTPSQSRADSRGKSGRRRTTVSLSQEAIAIVERLKSVNGFSTSGVIEELILHSEPRKPRIKMLNGLAVFDVEFEGGPLTTEQILALEDQPW